MNGEIRFGLRAQVLGVIVGLLLAAQLITMVAVLFATHSNAISQAHADIALGSRVFSELFDARARQLEDSVGVLVKDFGFKSAVATGDRDTISLTLLNQRARIAADLMLFQNLDGQFIGASSDVTDGWSQTDLSRLTLAAGHGTGASQLVLELDGAPYQVIGAPVFAPGEVGTIWTGFALGDELAQQLRLLTAMDVSFVARGDASVFASSLNETRRTAVSSLPLASANNEAVEATLVDAEYLTRALPLQGDDSVLALLHVSLVEAMQPYETLKWQLSIVFVLTLGMSLLLASRLSRSVTEPVRWLLSAARRIGQGDYGRPITTNRKDELGELARTFNTMQRGIAEREASIVHAAVHDTLTDLPSRAIVDDRLESAVLRAKRNHHAFCVVLMDLNRFKEINDTLGHQIGDKVLQTIADRLRTIVRKSDTAARLGGDEFLLILDNSEPEQTRETIHRFYAQLTAPMKINDIQINVDVSMGLAAYPRDATDAASLLRRADIAMYSAKESQVALSLYREGQDEEHLHKLSLISDLCKAVDNDGLSLFYQPKVTTSDGSVEQVEALVRWTHPEHGMVFPDEFISLAEESGNIGLVTDWVLNEAVRQIAEWQGMDIHMNVAVNLSALDLLDERLPERIEKIIEHHGVAIDCLNLEVTESAMMQDAIRATATLNRLRDLGATISIDDFGTGHSSLAQLKSLPVQVLKIDKSFVMNMATNADDEVIVRSTIELAHNMGLKVVAEGVDNTRSLELLRRYGCEYLQGYYFSKPVDAQAFTAWLHEYSAQRVA